LSNQVKLQALPRAAAGKGETNRLRREGRVPAIVYGHGVEPTAVSVNERELFRALNGPAGRNALIALDIAGTATLTVVRDLQRHAVRRDVLHLDFVAVDRDVRIDVDVPVRLVDIGDVLPDGGFLNHVRHSVPISVRPLDTPDFFEVSVAGMGIGDLKRLGDLAALLPAGAELADDPDAVVVTINAPAGGGAEAGTDGEAGEAAAVPGETAAAADGAAGA